MFDNIILPKVVSIIEKLANKFLDKEQDKECFDNIQVLKTLVEALKHQEQLNAKCAEDWFSKVLEQFPDKSEHYYNRNKE